MMVSLPRAVRKIEKNGSEKNIKLHFQKNKIKDELKSFEIFNRLYLTNMCNKFLINQIKI